jgi:thioesterase domain-containing protein
LAIKSQYLTPGYWRRPDLTERVLLADPAGSSERIYLTGDLGRVRADGRLEHLGRTDFRVKVRGQTIEVAEIETALLAMPVVKEAVVAAQVDPHGDTSLVAYLTLHPGSIPTATELRTLLSQKLPMHMVPAAFMLLDAIPLSANGKVDRRALPSQPGVRLGSSPSFVPPRDSIEEGLVRIWKDLLGVDAVGVHDDFFEFGGNSLLAAQLLARIEETFGPRLPLATFLQGATIAFLARQVPAAPAASTWRSLVPIRPEGERPPLFLVHAGFGDVLCFAGVVKALGPEQPCYGLQARGLDGATSPLNRVEDIARYYIEEIRTVQPAGPYRIGGLSSGATIAYEMAQQLRASGERVALLASFDGAATPVHQPRHVNALYVMRFLANIASNAPHWLRAAARSPRNDVQAQVQRRLKVVRRTLVRLLRRGEWSRYPGQDMLMEEIVDVLGLERAEDWPEYRRAVAENLHQAVAAYQPQPYPGRLVLFRARWQPLFSSHDPTLGWGKFALGGVTRHVIPGNHDSILYSPNVEQLAAHLTAHLTAASC